MGDKGNIINEVLKEWYIEENLALTRLNANYQMLVRRLEGQIVALAHQVSTRNYHISRLQDQIVHSTVRQRVLVDLNGSLHIFQRNADGIYIQVPEDVDDDETDSENIFEDEDPHDIARRLGFESDSEYESDDLMDRLMGE